LTPPLRRSADRVHYRTHLHADFVSGHHELAERSGARIYLGEGAGATFAHTAVKDGDSIQFGNCRFDFLQTPGHTIESVCIVMTDLAASSHPRAVFTGDTLFVGDVGRPDLSGDRSPQELAAMLYNSLHEKLLTLPDETEIFPAHGAGSLCGRQMSAERSSTIGKERAGNYALQARSCEEFIHLLTDSLPPRPEYFGREVELNRQGRGGADQLPPPAPVRAPEVFRLQSEGAIVLDTRPAMQFAVAHVPGSVHIALSGQYASWAARILASTSASSWSARTPIICASPVAAGSRGDRERAGVSGRRNHGLDQGGLRARLHPTDLGAGVRGAARYGEGSHHCP